MGAHSLGRGEGLSKEMAGLKTGTTISAIFCRLQISGTGSQNLSILYARVTRNCRNVSHIFDQSIVVNRNLLLTQHKENVK